jgi:hypothetical protein
MDVGTLPDSIVLDRERLLTLLAERQNPASVADDFADLENGCP